MRIAIAAFALCLGIAAQPALAYENFIPLGHNYSPDDPELPALNSQQDRVNSQVDIYEAEIYTRQRRNKVFNSQLNQFSNDQEYRGYKEFIDY
ncbi:MAG TPA: hypothetical protein P5337_11905 [Aestuariivirga sp.]|nr:hypothetical protein [Alphaproteobacteria bacterium]HRX37093.1 hypothetical protein [Aestuariivirga sp.]